MIPEIHGPVTTEHHTQNAAADAIRSTGTRLNAPLEDTELVLNVLFAQVIS